MGKPSKTMTLDELYEADERMRERRLEADRADAWLFLEQISREPDEPIFDNDCEAAHEEAAPPFAQMLLMSEEEPTDEDPEDASS